MSGLENIFLNYWEITGDQSNKKNWVKVVDIYEFFKQIEKDHSIINNKLAEFNIIKKQGKGFEGNTKYFMGLKRKTIIYNDNYDPETGEIFLLKIIYFKK